MITVLKNIFSGKFKHVFIVLLITLLSIPTFWRVLKPGYFKIHDDLQVVRVYEMSKCLKDGQIPCRWVPDMGYRFGYPQFNYYGPIPYYFMSFLNLAGINLFDAMKIGFILPAILGNIGMFYLGASLFGGAGGVVAATLYAFSPYRGSDTFARGAMGEVWAFIFLPLIVLAIKKLSEKATLKNSAFLALSFAGLLATHNVTTLMFTPLILFYIAFLVLQKSKFNSKAIFRESKKYVLSFLWGGAIAAFFFLPVIFEKQFAHTESMIGGYFDYRAHFVTFRQLFFTSFWSYGSSEIGPADDMSFFFSPILILTIFVTFVLLLKRIKERRYGNAEIAVSIFFILGVISTFMTHEKSSFIWSLISPLVYLQFPWRFLLVANFFLIIAGAYTFSNLRLHKNLWILVYFFLASFLFSASYFRPVANQNLTVDEKMSGVLWDRQMTISIFDYLPTSAKTPPNFPAPIYPSSSSRYYYIENFKSGTNWVSFDYNSTGSSSLTLNILDFPGWKTYDYGKEIIHTNTKDGLISVNLSEGDHSLLAKLTNTPVRLIGNLLTIIFLPFAIYSLFNKRRNVSKS